MTLSRGARITGAALAVLLALISAAWIGRDLQAAGDPAALWRHWTGEPRIGGPLVTTVVEPTLLLLYAAVAVAAPRSAVAASALVAAALVTLAVRLPALWVLTASYMDLQATDGLRALALWTAFAALGLGTGLIVTAVAGRRPAGARPHEDAWSPRTRGGAQRLTPTRPAHGTGVLALLLLGTAAAVTLAWQVRWAYVLGAETWLDLFTGGARAPVQLLEPPSAWLALSVALLALVAGGGGVVRAVHTRPLGAAVAGLLCAHGTARTGLFVRQGVFGEFGAVPLERRLLLATALFELVAGALLVVLLVRRGEELPDGGAWAGGGPDAGCLGGYGYPPATGYGRPPAPGHGHPPRTGPGRAPPPGYGYPPAPPSSRPPGW